MAHLNLYRGRPSGTRGAAQAEARATRSLSELSQVVEQGAADFAFEDFGHAGDRTGRLVERNALDTGHGEEDSWQTYALGVELIDFVDEMIEGIQVDSADGHATGINVEQDAPDFLFRRMQTEDDDGVGVHRGLIVSGISLPHASWRSVNILRGVTNLERLLPKVGGRECTFGQLHPFAGDELHEHRSRAVKREEQGRFGERTDLLNGGVGGHFAE